MVSAPEHPQRQLLPMHFLFFLFPYPDGITNTDNVQSMLVQSLYINDVSDKARKQKYLGYLTKQSFWFFSWKETKLPERMWTNQQAVMLLSFHSVAQKTKKGQNCFSPVTQPRRLSTHHYPHYSDEWVVVVKSRGIQSLSDERGFVRD